MPWIDKPLYNILQDISSDLARIERKLSRYNLAEVRRDEMAQQDIDRLKTAVERNSTVSGSAVALIQGLAQQIRDAGDDPAELKALAESIEAQAQGLADAITANTPTPPSA